MSERSNGTHTGRRTVDVKGPKVLVSMLVVKQIPFRLLLAQSYSISIIGIDNFMYRETTFKFMFGGLMSFGT